MPVTIHLKRNGPLLIEATDVPEIRVIDADGRDITPAPGKVVKLCRCGASAIKPFCDGSHKRVGFQSDPPPPGEAEATGAAARAGGGGRTEPGGPNHGPPAQGTTGGTAGGTGSTGSTAGGSTGGA